MISFKSKENAIFIEFYMKNNKKLSIFSWKSIEICFFKKYSETSSIMSGLLKFSSFSRLFFTISQVNSSELSKICWKFVLFSKEIIGHPNFLKYLWASESLRQEISTLILSGKCFGSQKEIWFSAEFSWKASIPSKIMMSFRFLEVCSLNFANENMRILNISSELELIVRDFQPISEELLQFLVE